MKTLPIITPIKRNKEEKKIKNILIIKKWYNFNSLLRKKKKKEKRKKENTTTHQYNNSNNKNSHLKNNNIWKQASWQAFRLANTVWMNVYGVFKCNFSQTHRYTPQKERGSVCASVSGGLQNMVLLVHSHGYPVRCLVWGQVGEKTGKPGRADCWPNIHIKYVQNLFFLLVKKEKRKHLTDVKAQVTAGRGPKLWGNTSQTHTHTHTGQKESWLYVTDKQIH